MDTMHADGFYPTIMTPRPPAGAVGKTPAAPGVRMQRRKD
jgi:hypothetical protein